MKHISTIALAIGASLVFLLLATPHSSEPVETPETIPETVATTSIQTVELLPIIKPVAFVSKGVTPIKQAGRAELTKAAFDVVKLQRQLGTSTTPETWILALEWCESNGDNTRINVIDRDGTSSFYAFQFKPSTFRNYAEKYGVIERGLSDFLVFEQLKDFDKSRATVWGMMSDASIVWENQFPDCIKKHLGRPPLVTM